MENSADSDRKISLPRAKARQSIWKKFLFAGVPVLLLLGIPELVLRLLHYPPPPVYDAYDLFWGIKPNLEQEPFYHKELGTYFKVSTNSHSLRYREIPLEQPANTIRILALGDSTTLGWGLEQDEAYPAQLERLLREKHPEVDIQVLNGGVPGYTSFQGLHHFKKNAAAYEPDIVLFGYIVQDARKTTISDKQQAINAHLAQTLRNSPIYKLNTMRLLRQRYSWLQSWMAERSNQEAAKDPTAMTRVPLEDYRENVLTFKRLCAKQHAQLVLFGFPLEVIGYTRHHRDLLTTMAGELGLPHFDPSNSVHELARRETLYFPKDKGHPNARGCAVIADLIAEYLEREQLLAKPIAARTGTMNR